MNQLLSTGTASDTARSLKRHKLAYSNFYFILPPEQGSAFSFRAQLFSLAATVSRIFNARRASIVTFRLRYTNEFVSYDVTQPS